MPVKGKMKQIRINGDGAKVQPMKAEISIRTKGRHVTLSYAISSEEKAIGDV